MHHCGNESHYHWSIYGTPDLAAIPLKSIPMSQHLKCQPNVRPCKYASHLRHWLCAGIVLTWTACFRDHDDVTESALTHVIQNPKAKYRVRCRLLRTLLTLIFWSTMAVLPFHMRCVMPRSVNACINSVIVLPILVSFWIIFNYHRYNFLPMNYEIVGECSSTNVVIF